ncbi:MAG: ABC transporter ATP-binding protein [Hyphomicrobiales bacterium]|nr:ABC transporter ATP-binding protein [Hyphomicrobiales bacterium]MCP5001910.1 ABC transporter ATP-binding protein [Hyphomicrobiales bacterium]
MSDTANGANYLEVQDLKVHFGKKGATVHAVDGVSFTVSKGTTFGIVGESGSGKTTTALAVMRLTHITDGHVSLEGRNIGALDGEELREARRAFQIIFQDPYSSLNPRQRAADIIREPLDLMEIGQPAERDGMVSDLIKQVGLRPEQGALFPHQFSGGQRQRIGLARALATKPSLIVCDEPVSALDVAIQAQILNLMANLQEELDLTYLFISHDLGVVQHICDEIAVMYLGQIVEQADRRTLFTAPEHPYTKTLLSAVPTLHAARGDRSKRQRLSGDPPSPINLPKGCRFASRCPLVEKQCHETPPPLRAVSGGHFVACHLAG